MPANFLSLPRELRDKIYELCLLPEEPNNPWDNDSNGSDDSDEGDLSLGLLGANKAINCEARLILYKNRFDFSLASPEDLSSFLEKIGRKNADCIRYIYVEFPVLHNLELGNVTIDADHTRALDSIQGYCTSLKTLTTSRRSTSAMELELDCLDNPKIVAEALTLVNNRFRAISSLKDIIVELNEYNLEDDMREQFENQG
ncbi:hypothetical protein VE02_06542 [Pseudogymnoascus sp. 03VT05]|nr:hypothetical protein VE02_06542 [Pseudogymnoascus sp. 03VT05]